MNNDMRIRNKLYKKMTSEYNFFINNLKTLPSDKVIDKAYEKVIKEELLIPFYPEYEYYDIKKIKALNSCEEPLEELYQNWMDSDVGINSVLEDSILDTLQELEIEKQEKNEEKER